MKLDFHDVFRQQFLVIRIAKKPSGPFLLDITFGFNKKLGLALSGTQDQLYNSVVFIFSIFQLFCPPFQPRNLLELIRKKLDVIYLGIQSIFYKVSVNQVNIVDLSFSTEKLLQSSERIDLSSC